jgi:YidC/Oxa1 family membrane protein insertase
VFIILFNVLSKELSSGLFLSSTLFGVIDLQAKGYVLPVLAAVVQYVQGKLTMGAQKKPKEASNDPVASMTSTMMVMGPILTFFILLNLPTALSLYWMVSSVFSVVQQLYINKQLPKFEDE